MLKKSNTGTVSRVWGSEYKISLTQPLKLILSYLLTINLIKKYISILHFYMLNLGTGLSIQDF